MENDLGRLLIPVGIFLGITAALSNISGRVFKYYVEKTALPIPGLLADPGPNVRFIPGFGESSLDFTLICQVREFTDQFTVQHELRKRIFKRFQQEGIVISYPHRTVYLRKEKGGNP